jgi:hypothetical protein
METGEDFYSLSKFQLLAVIDEEKKNEELDENI